MALDIYDLIKKVRKVAKISKRLVASGAAGPHPSDIANMSYQVINHTKGEVQKYDFKINPTTLKTTIVQGSKTQIPNEIINEKNFSQKRYAEMMKSRDPIFLKDTGDKENTLNQTDISKDSFA